MAEESVKKRLRKARESALSELFKQGYDAIRSDDEMFSLVAVKKRKIRFIKIDTDKISEEGRRMIRSFATSSKTISREIWLRKFRKKGFEIIKIE